MDRQKDGQTERWTDRGWRARKFISQVKSKSRDKNLQGKATIWIATNS